MNICEKVYRVNDSRFMNEERKKENACRGETPRQAEIGKIIPLTR
jgi:hypothetical protein